MDILSAYKFVHHLCVWCLQRPEKLMNLLKLDLRMVVNPHMGAEAQIRVFLNSQSS